jgi:hypothetical protein
MGELAINPTRVRHTFGTSRSVRPSWGEEVTKSLFDPWIVFASEALSKQVSRVQSALTIGKPRNPRNQGKPAKS